MTAKTEPSVEDQASEASSAVEQIIDAQPAQPAQPVPGLLVRDGSYVIEHGDFVRISDDGGPA